MNAEQIRQAQALLACPEESVSSIARMLGASQMVTRLPLGTHHSPAVSLKTWASGTEKFQFPVPDKYRICAKPHDLAHVRDVSEYPPQTGTHLRGVTSGSGLFGPVLRRQIGFDLSWEAPEKNASAPDRAARAGAGSLSG